MRVFGFFIALFNAYMLDEYGFDFAHSIGLLIGIALLVGFSVLSRVFIVFKENIHAPK